MPISAQNKRAPLDVRRVWYREKQVAIQPVSGPITMVILESVPARQPERSNSPTRLPGLVPISARKKKLLWMCVCV